MPARYRTMAKLGLPRWLVEDEGELVHYSLGLLVDAFLTRLYQGVYARFPDFAPDDALPHLGRDRKIVRGRDEDRTTYAGRLIRWLDDHRVRGNPWALLKQLRAYIGEDIRIRTVDASGNWFTIEANGDEEYLLAQGNWDWDGAPATNWSKFWVIIYSTGGVPWSRDGTWNDGETWGEPGQGTWGSTATVEEVDTIRAIVREWMPRHARCLNLIVSFSDSAFDPTDTNPPLPDGTWGNWSKLVGGVQVPARDPDGIYWDGPRRAA